MGSMTDGVLGSRFIDRLNDGRRQMGCFRMFVCKRSEHEKKPLNRLSERQNKLSETRQSQTQEPGILNIPRRTHPMKCPRVAGSGLFLQVSASLTKLGKSQLATFSILFGPALLEGSGFGKIRKKTMFLLWGGGGVGLKSGRPHFRVLQYP